MLNLFSPVMKWSRFDDQSHGLYRRLMYIPFNASFSKDDKDYEPEY